MLPDGIYFGLKDDDYHAEPRLSASSIKNLLVSPMDFWARCPWLNPAAKDEDDEPEWAVKGRAYHVRICEGKETFYRRYGSEFTAPPDCLKTAEDLKNECRALELKLGGSKDELIERLLAAGCRKPIFDVLEDEYREAHKGRTLLKADWIYDIELAAACIERHPTLSKCFTGGFPEVAVMWTEEVEKNDGSGEFFKVPMKMKADYLKPAAIVDLKTFANRMQKPLDRAVYYDMAAHRYHLQATVYYSGMIAAKAFIEKRTVNVLSGAAPTAAWLQAVAKLDKQFVFVFQQKGPAPVAAGYVLPAELGLVSVGRAQVREAQQRFHECMEHYGSSPWIMDRALSMIGDNDIPQFATE